MKSVYALALPSDQLMFTIMRACIGVKKIDELWFLSAYAKRLVYNI